MTDSEMFNEEVNEEDSDDEDDFLGVEENDWLLFGKILVLGQLCYEQFTQFKKTMYHLGSINFKITAC